MPANPTCVITAGACDMIRFVVGTTGPSTRSVIGSIIAVPIGYMLADVPLQFDAGLVNICDPLGCFFNDTTVGLVGQTGWARLMQPLGGNPCQPGVYYPLVPEWEVFSLCCY